jgi:hypothetical protein
MREHARNQQFSEHLSWRLSEFIDSWNQPLHCDFPIPLVHGGSLPCKIWCSSETSSSPSICLWRLSESFDSWNQLLSSPVGCVKTRALKSIRIYCHLIALAWESRLSHHQRIYCHIITFEGRWRTRVMPISIISDFRGVRTNRFEDPDGLQVEV